MALLFAAVLAAYCLEDIAFIAASGKYLSPVAFGPWVDGLPDLVRHFCRVQDFKDRCDFERAITCQLFSEQLYVPQKNFVLHALTFSLKPYAF